jgi:hypothetical protein
MNDDPEWFAPKRFGYGAGLPIRWQGWVLTIGYTCIAVALAFIFRDRPVALIAALALPSVAFFVITAWTTRGRWRWRWGKRDDDD